MKHRLARRLLALGDSVECPCCGHTFRRFLSQAGRPDARCPACQSLERHRTLWLYLQAETDLFERPQRVLHFAPEDFLRRRFRQIHADYVTTDLEAGDVDVRADITALPFDDGSFDAILCSHVLEHVSDDRQAMRELRRVLRPGGFAIVMVPGHAGEALTDEDPAAGEEERLRRFGQADHVRRYGTDLQERLEEAGFRVAVEDYMAVLGEEAFRRYRLGGGPIYTAYYT